MLFHSWVLFHHHSETKSCVVITGTCCQEDRQCLTVPVWRRKFPRGHLQHFTAQASKHRASHRLLHWARAKTPRVRVHWKWHTSWYTALLWRDGQETHMEHPCEDSTGRRPRSRVRRHYSNLSIFRTPCYSDLTCSIWSDSPGTCTRCACPLSCTGASNRLTSCSMRSTARICLTAGLLLSHQILRGR